jgi:hypothetical protein
MRCGWRNRLPSLSLLRVSSLPPEEVHQLRHLTRTRANCIYEHTANMSGWRKGLETSTIKLSSVASTLHTQSAHRTLEALMTGEREPHILAWRANEAMVKKSAARIEAVTGRFTEHHGFMVNIHLHCIDQIEATITLL